MLNKNLIFFTFVIFTTVFAAAQAEPRAFHPEAREHPGVWAEYVVGAVLLLPHVEVFFPVVPLPSLPNVRTRIHQNPLFISTAASQMMTTAVYVISITAYAGILSLKEGIILSPHVP